MTLGFVGFSTKTMIIHQRNTFMELISIVIWHSLICEIALNIQMILLLDEFGGPFTIRSWITNKKIVYTFGNIKMWYVFEHYSLMTITTYWFSNVFFSSSTTCMVKQTSLEFTFKISVAKIYNFKFKWK